jgi:ubiquitin carboxyl-terminal hydrolase 35/38
MTKQFSREILVTPRTDNVCVELQKLFALMLCSPRPEQNPRSVVNLIRPEDFQAGVQHDSSEFLCFLLDILHEEEKKRLKNDEDWDDADPSDGASADTNPHPMEVDGAQNVEEEEKQQHEDEITDKVIDNTANLSYTYIQKIFGGKISTRYLCKSCNRNSINVDAFRDLQLSFPERLQDENCDMQYNVQQLLEYYFSTEELNVISNNQYHCGNCKILCNGVRCTEMLEPPKNLILTLKHFRYDSRKHTRSKLLHKVFHDEHISVTVKGSLESNSTRNVDYKLYAAVIHSGNSLDNGHYYTIARENDTDWFKFNDSYVTKSSLEELRG